MEHMTEILAAARGDSPCDLALLNGTVINTFTCEKLQGDVGIKNGVIVGIGEYQGSEEIDVSGKYIAPGFIEAHYHIESSMLRPSELTSVIVPRGTTCMVADPHEIANVAGLAGIEFLLADSDEIPMDLYLMAPSCVPSTEFDSSGASITERDIEHLYRHPRILGLGEVMDYTSVVNARPNILRKIEISEGRPVDGHAPMLSGPELSAYIAAGPRSDHECSTPEEALEKARLGMTVMIRGSGDGQNLAGMLSVVNPLNCGQFILVTDDRGADELDRHGHLDHLLMQAVDAGIDPALAVRLVTLNPALYFGLKRRGAVAPGYMADLVVLEDLRSFRVSRVYRSGKLVARQGRLLSEVSRSTLQPAVVDTVQLDRAALDDLWISFRSPDPAVRVMELVPGTILTRTSLEKVRTGTGTDRSFAFDPSVDLCPVFVLERHHNTGRVGRGLVRGFGLRKGAIASSFAHDSHNIICACADPVSARTAILAVAESGGGYSVAIDREVIGLLRLPVCGLISDGTVDDLLRGLARIDKAVRETGCSLSRPFFDLSFLSLPVVPELKLTDRGLVEVGSMELVELELEE
ncbi:MAG: adenine deaminase [bacterium]|nr:MAG: adenine deaminase [bacterium]